MKKWNVGIFSTLVVILMVITGCQMQQDQNQQGQDQQMEPRSNGFVNIDDPAVQGKQWKMGTQATVDLITSMGDDYNAQNVDAVMSVIADSAVFYFADGAIVTGKDSLREGLTGYINAMESYEWTTVFAYAVDLDLTEGGEWVFIGGDEYRNPKEGEEYTLGLVEAWYVIDGVVHEMHQFERKQSLMPDDSNSDSEEE